MSLAWGEGPWRPELASYRAIDIRCDDCGRTKRLQVAEISRFIRAGTHSLIGLHDKLYCSVCRDRGGLGKNIDLKPRPRSE